MLLMKFKNYLVQKLVGIYSFQRNWILKFRNTSKSCASLELLVVIATAQDIIMNKDVNLLYSNGGGGIKLTNEWAKSLLYQMGYVEKVYSKAKFNVEHF